jgi:hypothetical protein
LKLSSNGCAGSRPLEVILGLIHLVGFLKLDAFSSTALAHVEEIDNKMISSHES